MHQAIWAGNAEIAKAISPIDICSHRRCARGAMENVWDRLDSRAGVFYHVRHEIRNGCIDHFRRLRAPWRWRVLRVRYAARAH